MQQRYGGAPGPVDLKGLDRFTLAARDLEKAELFYTRVLGGEVLSRDAMEVGGFGHPSLRVQLCRGVQVSLVKQRYGWLPIDSSIPHWGFEIEGADVDQWVRHLSTWGVPSVLVFRDDYIVPEGVPTRVELHFLDPDGNQIELVAWDYPMNDRAFRGHYNPWTLGYRHDRWPPNDG